MNILITGASGFIGSWLCEEGLARGYKVWAGVRATSSRKYLAHLPGLQWAELDLEHPDALRKQLALHREEHGGWDVVVHAAGVTKCRRTEEFDRGNYLCTRHLVEGLKAEGITPKQLVYLSSLSVFGPVREKKQSSAAGGQPSIYSYSPILETDALQPNTAYGRSKLKAERYLQSAEAGVPVVIFRPTGVYGPRERDYFLMAKSIKGHIDFVPGLSRQKLTFVYVKDLARAIFLAVAQGVTGRAYFVSDGDVHESRDFSDLLCKELGNPWFVRVKCPLWLLKTVCYVVGWGAGLMGKASTLNADKYRIMKQRNWQCDIRPLVKELGYRPEYPLERGVKESIDWYRKEGWL